MKIAGLVLVFWVLLQGIFLLRIGFAPSLKSLGWWLCIVGCFVAAGLWLQWSRAKLVGHIFGTVMMAIYILYAVRGGLDKPAVVWVQPFVMLVFIVVLSWLPSNKNKGEFN